jgi:hypothetical protein
MVSIHNPTTTPRHYPRTGATARAIDGKIYVAAEGDGVSGTIAATEV